MEFVSEFQSWSWFPFLGVTVQLECSFGIFKNQTKWARSKEILHWSVFPRSSDWIFLSLRCFILRFCLSTYSLIPPPLSVSPFGPSFTSLRCYFNVQFSLNFNWVLSLNHVGVTLHHHVTTSSEAPDEFQYRLEEIYEPSIKQTHPTLTYLKRPVCESYLASGTYYI